MASLTPLQQFQNMFTQIVNSLQYYSNNLRNEIFEQNYEESDQQAFQRGECIFDQSEENLRNLNEILEKEKEINEFFSLCKENKKKIIDFNNELISQMMIIKKRCSNKEEYLETRKEWNKKRIEKPDEKNRRECEEMLEEINDRINDLNDQKKEFKEERNKFMEEVEKMKEQQKEFNEQMEMMRKEREEMSVKKEFEEIAKEYVKKSEFNDVAKDYVKKNHYENNMIAYVKKDDYEYDMREYLKKDDYENDKRKRREEKEKRREEEEKRTPCEKFERKYYIGSKWHVKEDTYVHEHCYYDFYDDSYKMSRSQFVTVTEVSYGADFPIKIRCEVLIYHDDDYVHWDYSTDIVEMWINESDLN